MNEKYVNLAALAHIIFILSCQTRRLLSIYFSLCIRSRYFPLFGNICSLGCVIVNASENNSGEGYQNSSLLSIVFGGRFIKKELILMKENLGASHVCFKK